MKDQPECDQPHNHEQTKPVPSFDWGESKANSFRQFFLLDSSKSSTANFPSYHHLLFNSLSRLLLWTNRNFYQL